MTPPHLASWTEAGTLVFLSGQLPFHPTEGLVEGDIAAQTARVLLNIEAVLRPAGLTPLDVVKTTVWLRDREDFAGFDRAYAAFFGDHRPARSTVVARLVVPEARVEIEAIAKRR